MASSSNHPSSDDDNVSTLKSQKSDSPSFFTSHPFLYSSLRILLLSLLFTLLTLALFYPKCPPAYHLHLLSTCVIFSLLLALLSSFLLSFRCTLTLCLPELCGYLGQSFLLLLAIYLLLSGSTANLMENLTRSSSSLSCLTLASQEESITSRHLMRDIQNQVQFRFLRSVDELQTISKAYSQTVEPLVREANRVKNFTNNVDLSILRAKQRCHSTWSRIVSHCSNILTNVRTGTQMIVTGTAAGVGNVIKGTATGVGNVVKNTQQSALRVLSTVTGTIGHATSVVRNTVSNLFNRTRTRRQTQNNVQQANSRCPGLDLGSNFCTALDSVTLTTASISKLISHLDELNAMFDFTVETPKDFKNAASLKQELKDSGVQTQPQTAFQIVNEQFQFAVGILNWIVLLPLLLLPVFAARFLLGILDKNENSGQNGGNASDEKGNWKNSAENSTRMEGMFVGGQIVKFFIIPLVFSCTILALERAVYLSVNVSEESKNTTVSKTLPTGSKNSFDFHVRNGSMLGLIAGVLEDGFDIEEDEYISWELDLHKCLVVPVEPSGWETLVPLGVVHCVLLGLVLIQGWIMKKRTKIVYYFYPEMEVERQAGFFEGFNNDMNMDMERKISGEEGSEVGIKKVMNEGLTQEIIKNELNLVGRSVVNSGAIQDTIIMELSKRRQSVE